MYFGLNCFAFFSMSGRPVVGSVIASGLRTRLFGASAAPFCLLVGTSDDGDDDDDDHDDDNGDDDDDDDDEEEVDETGFDGAGGRWVLQKHAPPRSGDASAYAIALVTLHRRPATVIPWHCVGSGAAGFPWLLQKLAPLRSGDAAAYAIALVTLHRRPAAVMPSHRVAFLFFDVFFDTGRGFGGSPTTAAPSLATRSAFSPVTGRFRFLSSSLS